MSSMETTPEGYEKYYVPESSSLAIRATIGLVCTVFGGGLVLNDMTFGDPAVASNSKWVLLFGLAFFALTLTSWFGTTIRENLQGMNSGQLSKSYVLGMFWFIFSEVMFFFAFFGALFYVRNLAGPWLAGEGEAGRMNELLWPGFDFSWPPVVTPQEAVGGADVQAIANNGIFASQERSMSLPMRILGTNGCPCGTPSFFCPQASPYTWRTRRSSMTNAVSSTCGWASPWRWVLCSCFYRQLNTTKLMSCLV